MDYSHLTAIEPPELANCRIGDLNLRLAQRLPGSEDLEITEMLAKVDAWPRLIRRFIERSRAHGKRILISNSISSELKESRGLA